MGFVFTHHALGSIAENQLTKSLVEDALKRPDEIIDGHKGRKIAHKRVGTKLLRVVFQEYPDNVYIVITAYIAKPERYEKK